MTRIHKYSIHTISNNQIKNRSLYPQQKEVASNGALCMPFREDYFECLHHKKEHAMVKQVMDQEKLNAKQAAGGESGHGHGGH